MKKQRQKEFEQLLYSGWILVLRFVGGGGGGAAWETQNVTWNLATNSAFALGQRKTTQNLQWVADRRTFRMRTD